MNLLHSLRRRLSLWILAGGIAVRSTEAAAQVAVGPAAGVTASTQHRYQTDYAAWFVADLADPLAPAPIQVAPGFASGAWKQEFTFDTAFPPLQAGSSWVVQELLRFGPGDFAIGGWSLEILSPDWKWTEGNLFNQATSFVVGGLSVTSGSQLLSLSFDPLVPGTEVFLAATLEYTGPNGASPSPILVQAVAAIPEPHPALLLTAGLVVLLVRRPPTRRR